MYSIVASPILRASSSPVFFCGMPIAVVGPVAETISPILTCAVAVPSNNPNVTRMAANLVSTWISGA